MNMISRPIIVMCLMMLTGCLQTVKFADLEPKLIEWESADEYGRALDTLAQIDPKDPNYSRAAGLRRQVEKRAAVYEQLVRKETKQKMDQGDWASALDQYDEVLDKYPRSAVIRDGQAQLNQQQQAALDKLERNLLIQRGKGLIKVLPIYRDIVRVDPRSRQTQNRLNRISNEAEQISSELTISGRKALADNDLAIAEETLLLAVELHKSPATKDSLQDLLERQKQVKTKQHESQVKKEKKARTKQENKKRKLNDLLKKFNHAFALPDFITARKHLAGIGKLEPRYEKLAAMRTKLKTAIDARVTSLFETGVNAYSRGEFEQAAKAWRAILQLDPDHNQSRENLQRAGKVLKKLAILKAKQGD